MEYSKEALEEERRLFDLFPQDQERREQVRTYGRYLYQCGVQAALKEAKKIIDESFNEGRTSDGNSTR